VPDDRRVLGGVDRLVVDGTNVLHALRRSADALPATALVGRLRAIVPPGVAVVVVLDGSPEHGLVSRHVASGVEVRYAGRRTADEVIAGIAEHELGSAVEGLLVVTDDVALATTIRAAGGRTVRNAWLIDRLGRQRLSAPSVGRSTVSPPGGLRSDSADEVETARWSPGRGATRKRGNPRRGH
jgi:predicted RNA-binding protein with PIN domain